MQNDPKRKSGATDGKGRKQAAVVTPTRATSPGGPGADVHNPRPAPGTSRDPLVHPGDEQDITPDVIAGERGQSKQSPRQQDGGAADRSGTEAGGPGNVKPR
jgi:uncharacterized sporulation protein YeaH/YhbH (DUF444 family)